MIEYNKKYYINISPRIYAEVKVNVENDKLVLTPTKNKIELNPNDEIKKVNKEELKEKLKQSGSLKKMDKTGIVKNKKRYE